MILRRTGRAPLRVGLAQYDGQMPEFGERRHNLEALCNVLQVLGNSHLYMALDQPRTALGVKADKVQRRSAAPSGVVAAGRAVLEKPPQEFSSLGTGRTRCGGTADPRARQGSLQRIGGEVVELVIILRFPLPVTDVRLVPDLPVPGLSLAATVPLGQVPREVIYQARPLVVIPGRVGPSRP